MFIVFEGGEGAGKTTLAAMVAERLRTTGREVVLTREPGGTPIGEEFRALLHRPLMPWAEAFTFLAARAQLIGEVIAPAVERRAIVLCDRFEASTYAYQAYGRGLDLELLRAANEAASTGLHADLTLWLDIAPAAGLARKQGEGAAISTGNENLAFHERVREGYRVQFEAARPGAWLRFDATRPPDALAEEIADLIAERAARAS